MASGRAGSRSCRQPGHRGRTRAHSRPTAQSALFSAVLGASALTAAELRLLPVLATHLTFREIAGQMSLSHSTVKAEATSIYRKLGTSSRNQAVMRARDLGLLDG